MARHSTRTTGSASDIDPVLRKVPQTDKLSIAQSPIYFAIFDFALMYKLGDTDLFAPTNASRHECQCSEHSGCRKATRHLDLAESLRYS